MEKDRDQHTPDEPEDWAVGTFVLEALSYYFFRMLEERT